MHTSYKWCIYIYKPFTYNLSLYVYIYMVPCPVFPPPPWDGGGMMPLWWCIYIHTYLHTYPPTYLPTYLRTYIHTYHYITLPYITLPYITLPYIPYIHTYTDTHTYIHTYITYIHTYLPLHYITLPYITLPYLTLPYIPYIHTYQHTNIPPPQATGGGDQKNHTTTTGHRGGGTRRTIPPPQATGGGGQKNRRYCPPIPIGGGGRGGGQRCTIYIYMYIEIYKSDFYNTVPLATALYFATVNSSFLTVKDYPGYPSQSRLVTRNLQIPWLRQTATGRQKTVGFRFGRLDLFLNLGFKAGNKTCVQFQHVDSTQLYYSGASTCSKGSKGGQFRDLGDIWRHNPFWSLDDQCLTGWQLSTLNIYGAHTHKWIINSMCVCGVHKHILIHIYCIIYTLICIIIDIQ